jgi:hypothetical protein
MARKPAKLDPIRFLAPRLPGPWQYVSLLSQASVVRNLLNDLPRAAYPLLALVVLRTVQTERRKNQQAILDAHRNAIRRSQTVFVVRRKKRFGLF